MGDERLVRSACSQESSFSSAGAGFGGKRMRVFGHDPECMAAPGGEGGLSRTP